MSSEPNVAERTHLIDLLFLDHPHYISCAVLEGDDGLALIDPGPASTLGSLEAGLNALGHDLAAVRSIVLTHIHLDHAGATGSIARRVPEARVLVHDKGAPHVIDPSRLISSAERLYGALMDQLWGEVLPVEADRVETLSGGERIVAGGRTLEVAYTPGHARHHVSFFDETTGIAYVGDTAGIRIDGHDYVLPVTPPPDIDLDVWPESLHAIAAWQPERLWVTHFGPGRNVPAHLESFRERLDAWSQRVESDLAAEKTDRQATEEFAEWVEAEMREHLTEDEAMTYGQGGSAQAQWAGLARYFRKRAQA